MFHKTKAAALRSSALATIAVLAAGAANAQGVEITYVSGAVGNAVNNFDALVAPWEEATGNDVVLVPMPASTTDQFGQYRLWLAAGNADIDSLQTDVIWAPQLAEHFVDLTQAATEAGIIEQNFPAIIESQTVDGKLVALPIFTDAPALYYRTDLLEKHGREVPTTWAELTETAQFIQDAERAEGNSELFGFVWQGNAYEGLTCNGLEWVKSFGGGQIVEPDGTISINNPQAVAALETAAGWVGTISPEGVLAYTEEESRGVWQTGNAVFMRNWPYAYLLGNSDDSAVAGKFDVAPLPMGEGEARPRPRRWGAGTWPSPGMVTTRTSLSTSSFMSPPPRRRSSAPSTRAICPRSSPSTRTRTCWRPTPSWLVGRRSS
jgi:trehalose/maltose transport system substrate-binding protein